MNKLDELNIRMLMLNANLDRETAQVMCAGPELLEALKVIIQGFESGIFVRDITMDSDSSWAVRLLPFIAALGKAQAAIAKAEGTA